MLSENWKLPASVYACTAWTYVVFCVLTMSTVTTSDYRSDFVQEFKDEYHAYHMPTICLPFYITPHLSSCNRQEVTTAVDEALSSLM